MRGTNKGELHVSEASFEQRQHAANHTRLHIARDTHEFDIVVILRPCNQFVAVEFQFLHHESLHVFLQLRILLDGFGDGRGEVGRVIEECAKPRHYIHLRIVQLVGFGSRNGFYTADTCGDTRLHHDTHGAYTPRGTNVATAAQLHRRTILNHAHIVAVFLAEERHCPHRFRLGYRRMARLLKTEIGTNQLVSQLLHLAQLLGGNFLIMREVETQRVGGYKATFLLHVVA